MNTTKEELIKIIKDRISEQVTAGGGELYYERVSLEKLAEYLYELTEQEKI
jgi:hypothetical protein